MFQTNKKGLKIIITEPDYRTSLPYFPSPRLLTHPTKPRYSNDLSTLPYNDHNSTLSTNEQDLSLHSIKTANTPKAFFHLPSDPLPATLSPTHDPRSHQFLLLERILKNENDNLKMQNELLLTQVHRLKQGNRRYRQLQKKTGLELEQMRLEREAQKRRADEMKEVIMSRLAQLEGKIIAGEVGGGSQCGSILEALTFSESGHK